LNPQILGSLILVVPALAVAWAAMWRRNRMVFWFALVLILVATGYLNATGAARDIGLRFGGAPAGVAAPAR
jgi:dipeptide/tripeptide permease